MLVGPGQSAHERGLPASVCLRCSLAPTVPAYMPGCGMPGVRPPGSTLTSVGAGGSRIKHRPLKDPLRHPPPRAPAGGSPSRQQGHLGGGLPLGGIALCPQLSQSPCLSGFGLTLCCDCLEFSNPFCFALDTAGYGAGPACWPPHSLGLSSSFISKCPSLRCTRGNSNRDSRRLPGHSLSSLSVTRLPVSPHGVTATHPKALSCPTRPGPSHLSGLGEQRSVPSCRLTPALKTTDGPSGVWRSFQGPFHPRAFAPLPLSPPRYNDGIQRSTRLCWGCVYITRAGTFTQASWALPMIRQSFPLNPDSPNTREGP